MLLETMLAAAWMAATPAAPAAPETDNAWAEWSRWEELMERLDPALLEPAQGLTAESRIRKDQLDSAREVKSALDLAVAKLRRGLRMPSCRKPQDGAGQVLRLGEAAAMRAFLAAEDGEDLSPIVLDLLAVGRRLGRCAGGGLLALEVGRTLEQRARTLAEWGARSGLLAGGARARVVAAFEDGALGRADLDRALEDEQKEALSLLPPPMGENNALYSRHETEALLAAKLQLLRKALSRPRPDVTKLDEEVRALVNDQEKAFLRELKDFGQGAPKEKLEALKRQKLPPNGIGRLFVQIILTPMVPHAVRLAAQLGPGVKLRLPARPRSGDWIADPLPPQPSWGRCTRVSEAHYRVDEATEAMVLKSDGELAPLAVRIVPVFKDGVAYGMKVSGFSTDSFPASCGFEPDDVVLSVNEIRLDSPENALQVHSSIREAGRAAFILQRQGREVRFAVSGAR